jgi:hypothetical protein
MQIARHPFEATRDPLGANQLVDLRNRRKPCIPRSACVIAAELLHQLRQPPVGDCRQMRRRAPRVAAGQAMALEQCDSATGGLEQVSRGYPDDAAADDADVNMQVAVEPVQHRKRYSFFPIRRCVHDRHLAVLQTAM